MVTSTDVREVQSKTKKARHGRTHMSHSLNSLKGGYIGDYIGGLL